MLHVDIPSRAEFRALNDVRSDACVSIYLETTPLTQESVASKRTTTDPPADAYTSWKARTSVSSNMRARSTRLCDHSWLAGKNR